MIAAIQTLSDSALTYAPRPLPPAFDVARKVIQNRLPTAPLLLDGMRCFCIKGNFHIDAVRCFFEFNFCCPVSKGEFKQPIRHDVGISPGEVKAKAAVL